MTIKKCTCKHEFQDQAYGRGNRVHTTDKKGELHCTVCGEDPIKRKMQSAAKGWLPVYNGGSSYLTKYKEAN